MLLSLPQTTGGFLSYILALVLPLAYGFQPNLVLVALGPAHGLQAPQAALLAALLRVPAGGRVLVLVEEVSWAEWRCCGVTSGERPVTLCFHLCPWPRNPHPSLQGSWSRHCVERAPPAWAPSPGPPQRTCRPWSICEGSWGHSGKCCRWPVRLGGKAQAGCLESWGHLALSSAARGARGPMGSGVLLQPLTAEPADPAPLPSSSRAVTR